MNNTIITTNLPFKIFTRGKVRDVYDLGENLLIVSSDRISAFDVVLPTPIPNKGKILTQLSSFWFEKTKHIIGNHLITSNVEEYPEELKKYANILEGRSMLVKKTKKIQLECIVRGYLSGSGYKEYKEKNSICGIELPSFLVESAKLPYPIFTPSTKAEVGHDENITYTQAENIVGKETFEILKEKSITIYEFARDYAEKAGIIIADTKFEFGYLNNEIILIDEILTPDSSRFWPLSQYKPGGPQSSFDKQYVRDYLETLNWDKKPPGPELPPDVVAKTEEKYKEALKNLVDL